MEHHVTTGRDGLLGAIAERAGQGAHGNIVAHQQAHKADRIANHVRHYIGRSGGRRDGVDCAKHNMGCHAHGQVAQWPKSRKITGLQACWIGGHDRQTVVAIGGRAAMTR